MAHEPPARVRKVEDVLEARAAIDGAGVHLRRAFGQTDVPRLDPFLLLDDFHSDNPAEYIAGFPWHPHRGIETVTYMVQGRVEHGDSMGNAGIVGDGDVQWMTAGSGIIHQEMPQRTDGALRGLQLWVNLPKTHKMTDPRYQEVKAPQIPLVEPHKGVRAKAIAGELGGVRGPVRDLQIAPQYLDVELKPRTVFEHAIPDGHTAFAYMLDGSAVLDPLRGEPLDARHLAIFGSGDGVRVEARGDGARFLLIAGKPLGQPVAWWGPIVMNTRKELAEAVDEYQNGTFIRAGRKPAAGTAETAAASR